jgi:hypothetical protein
MQDDTANARAAYNNFLTLWKDADPNIPVLKQAKAEFAKLRREGPNLSQVFPPFMNSSQILSRAFARVLTNSKRTVLAVSSANLPLQD